MRDCTSLRAIAEASGLSGARFTVHSVCRPDAYDRRGKLKKPTGGLAVLCFNSRLSIDIERQEKKGLLSFIISCPGMQSLAFVGTYIPDASSVFVHWTDGLVAAGVEEVNRLRQRFGNWVFYMGDVNMRHGRPPGSNRFTPDTKATGPRGAMLRSALKAMQFSPIHGRTWDLRAAFTSRHICPPQVGFSEVDIIAAATALPSSTFRLIPTPNWGDVELPDNGSHLPLLIEVEVPVKLNAPATAPPRRKKPFCNPPFSDAGWFRMCERIQEGVQHARHELMLPDATPSSMYKALHELHRSAAIAQFGTAIVRTRTYRHRLYRGAPLPAPLVAMFADARHLRQLASRANNSQRKQMLHDQAHVIAKAAKCLAESYVRRFLGQMVLNVEHERCVYPHKMHAQMRLLEGTDSTRCIDSARIPVGPDGTDPLVLFYLKFGGLGLEVDGLPQGPQTPLFMDEVPQSAPAVDLMHAFTPQAIYWLLYPATKRHKYKACHDSCKICASFIASLDAWRPNDRNSPVPCHSPSMRMGRSAGPDELIAELIRFVRPEAYEDRYSHRMAICELVSMWFNEMLRSGRVPEGDFAKCTTTPLLKAVKPGQPVPPLWNPDMYRGITNGNMLGKLFSVALAMRMSHWAVRTGVLGPEQVAFLNFHGTEEHVFSLLQVARARARDGQSTYALFVDFQKAYDMVHQGALWAVLERMGVPVKLVSLLRDWAAKRRTCVKVNGNLSAEYPMAKGVPQGDPLSCLLFSLFIESLSRYLKSRPDLAGVTAFGGQFCLRQLLYADDLVVLANSPEELQRALSHVKAWSDAWRMPISIGAGKTEAMHLSVASPRIVDPAPLQLSPGQLVQWVDSYKYLGYVLRSDLRDEDATARLKEHMEFMWNSKFVHSGVVRRASPTFQLQYFSCLVQGALQYLRSLTVCSSSLASSLETCLSGYQKVILRLPSKSPTELVAATARLPPWGAVHVQHHERLYQQLLHTPFQQSIAAQLFRCARADVRHGTSIATRNWVAYWESERLTWFARGVPIPPINLSYKNIADMTSSFARAGAFWKWQQNGKVDNGIRNGDTSFDATLRPSWMPKLAVAALYEGFQAPMSSLGMHPRFTPLSTHGPMCQGSLLSMSTIPAFKLAVVGHLRLGAKALQMAVLSLKARGKHHDYGADENHDPCSRFAVRREDCPLCGVSPLDVFHLACECTDAALVTWRSYAIPAARQLLFDIAVFLETAHDNAGRDVSDLCSDVIGESTVVDFSSDAGRFILFRLLLCHPWSARVAASDGSHYSIEIVGKLFDADGMHNMYLRPLADMWGRWCIRWGWRLGNAWRDANANHDRN